MARAALLLLIPGVALVAFALGNPYLGWALSKALLGLLLASKAPRSWHPRPPGHVGLVPRRRAREDPQLYLTSQAIRSAARRKVMPSGLVWPG